MSPQNENQLENLLKQPLSPRSRMSMQAELSSDSMRPSVPAHQASHSQSNPP